MIDKLIWNVAYGMTRIIDSRDVKIDTTMRYAMVHQSNVKNAHRKFIG